MFDQLNQQKRISRRDFLKGILVAAAGSAMAACTPAATQAPTETESQTPTEAPKPEKVTLEWYTCYGSWGEPGLQSIVDDYVQKNPDVSFKPIVYAQSSTQGALEGLLSRIAAGESPDIALMWDSPVSLGVRGAYVVLDDLMATSENSKKEDWPEMMFRSCNFRGKSYGFPSYNAIYGICYNETAFEEKGLSINPDDFPKTWGELKEISKLFTEYEGQKPKTVGYFPLWNVHTDQWFQFNGGGCYDYENSTYHVDLPQNIETLEYGLQWIKDEYQGSYDGVKGMGWDFWDDLGGEPSFQVGKIIMIQGGNWSVSGYLSEVGFKDPWNIARFPLGPSSTNSKLYSSYIGNWLSIPTGSKNINAAFTFIDWVNGDGVMGWLTNGASDSPGSKKFYEKRPNFITPLFEQYLPPEKAKQFQAYFEDAALHAADMYASPIASFQWDQASRAAERVLKNAVTATEALQEAQKACSEELKRVLEGQ